MPLQSLGEQRKNVSLTRLEPKQPVEQEQVESRQYTWENRRKPSNVVYTDTGPGESYKGWSTLQRKRKPLDWRSMRKPLNTVYADAGKEDAYTGFSQIKHEPQRRPISQPNPKVLESHKFFESIGYPQFGGRYTPFTIPEGAHVESIVESEGGLKIEFDTPEQELSREFYTSIGYPQFGGKYAPFTVPPKTKISNIVESETGLNIEFENEASANRRDFSIFVNDAGYGYRLMPAYPKPIAGMAEWAKQVSDWEASGGHAKVWGWEAGVWKEKEVDVPKPEPPPSMAMWVLDRQTEAAMAEIRFVRMINASNLSNEEKKTLLSKYVSGVAEHFAIQEVRAVSRKFYEGLGFPEFGGKYQPFTVPSGAKVKGISETSEGLKIEFEQTGSVAVAPTVENYFDFKGKDAQGQDVPLREEYLFVQGKEEPLKLPKSLGTSAFTESLLAPVEKKIVKEEWLSEQLYNVQMGSELVVTGKGLTTQSMRPFAPLAFLIAPAEYFVYNIATILRGSDFPSISTPPSTPTLFTNPVGVIQAGRTAMAASLLGEILLSETLGLGFNVGLETVGKAVSPVTKLVQVSEPYVAARGSYFELVNWLKGTPPDWVGIGGREIESQWGWSDDLATGSTKSMRVPSKHLLGSYVKTAPINELEEAYGMPFYRQQSLWYDIPTKEFAQSHALERQALWTIQRRAIENQMPWSIGLSPATGITLEGAMAEVEGLPKGMTLKNPSLNEQLSQAETMSSYKMEYSMGRGATGKPLEASRLGFIDKVSRSDNVGELFFTKEESLISKGGLDTDFSAYIPSLHAYSVPTGKTSPWTLRSAFEFQQSTQYDYPSRLFIPKPSTDELFYRVFSKTNPFLGSVEGAKGEVALLKRVFSVATPISKTLEAATSQTTVSSYKTRGSDVIQTPKLTDQTSKVVSTETNQSLILQPAQKVSSGVTVKEMSFGEMAPIPIMQFWHGKAFPFMSPSRRQDEEAEIEVLSYPKTFSGTVNKITSVSVPKTGLFRGLDTSSFLTPKSGSRLTQFNTTKLAPATVSKSNVKLNQGLKQTPIQLTHLSQKPVAILKPMSLPVSSLKLGQKLTQATQQVTQQITTPTYKTSLNIPIPVYVPTPSPTPPPPPENTWLPPQLEGSFTHKKGKRKRKKAKGGIADWYVVDWPLSKPEDFLKRF